ISSSLSVRRWKRLAGLRGRGRIQRGGRSPLIGRCGGRFLGGGHSRKCPPPKCPFGYFSDKRKVTRGVGAEPPQNEVWAPLHLNNCLFWLLAGDHALHMEHRPVLLAVGVPVLHPAHGGDL